MNQKNFRYGELRIRKVYCLNCKNDIWNECSKCKQEFNIDEEIFTNCYERKEHICKECYNKLKEVKK